MPHAHTKASFRQKFWHEAEPLIIHIPVILILDIALLLMGLLALSLKKLFPEREWYFNMIEQVDIWLALVILFGFGLFTLIRIVIRMSVSIALEVCSGVEIVGESVRKMLRKSGQQKTQRSGKK